MKFSPTTAEEALLWQGLEAAGLTQHILLGEQGPELRSPQEGERPVRLDFDADFAQWQRTTQAKRSQPLYRALGVRNNQLPVVWDVTCGLAGDSLQLLALGAKVVSSERHPLVAFLLSCAYQRWVHPIKAHWRLALQLTTPPPEAQVIYFDPMYSESNPKALPRKEMRVFRELVGEDHDAVSVAEGLRQQGLRLIIKRPPKAAPLLAAPHFAQEGKAVRFDVYLP